MQSETVIDVPTVADGAEMWRMALSCGLDQNSPYKYLLFCRDFAETSAIVRVDGEPAGFVTGYRRPATGALFVWQVGVQDRFRNRGLALAMLVHLHQRGASPSEHLAPEYLEATVTPDNAASRRLFAAFSEQVGAPYREEMLFPAELFPHPHEPEMLVQIGPIPGRHHLGRDTDQEGAPSA